MENLILNNSEIKQMAKSPKQYTIKITHVRMMSESTQTQTSGTLQELIAYFKYTLESGASYNGDKGCKKVNCNPKTIKGLITSLNNASCNTSMHYQSKFYELVEDVA
jgi:hypothetical protein